MSYGAYTLGRHGHEGASSYEGLRATDVIALLDLSPLPGEGGFFKQTLKSEENAEISAEDVGRYVGERFKYTLIDFLMTESQFSALHALKSDESWTFIAGAPVEITIINPENGAKEVVTLNADHPSHVVPRDHWFGARSLVDSANDYSLVTCEVRPGFEFADFVLVTPADVLTRYPALAETVARLTRPAPAAHHEHVGVIGLGGGGAEARHDPAPSMGAM